MSIADWAKVFFPSSPIDYIQVRPMLNQQSLGYQVKIYSQHTNKHRRKVGWNFKMDGWLQ